MPVSIRQTDNADRLPPQSGAHVAAPWERTPRHTLGWREILALLIGGTLALCIVFGLVWLAFGSRIRDWLDYGNGGTFVGLLPWLALIGAIVWFWDRRHARRLIEQPGGVKLFASQVRAADGAELMRGIVATQYGYATTSGHLLAQQTYSPTIQMQQAKDIPALVSAPSPAAPALPPGGSELEMLIARGAVCRSGSQLLIGYAGEQPRYLNPDLAPVVAFAGASQSGKSSAVRFLLAQLAMMPEPVGMVLCDPHGKAADRSLAVSCRALAPAWLWEPAIEPETIMASVRQFVAIGARRMDGSDPSRWPAILVIDEFTAMMDQDAQYVDVFTKLCRAISNQYAKVGLRLFVIGQSWNADLAGGTALRSGIQASIVAACKKQQAAFLLSTDEAKLAETLRPQSGDVLLKAHWAEPIERVRVPWVGASHLSALAERVRPAPSWRPARMTDQQPAVARPAVAQQRRNETARASVSVGDLLSQPLPPTIATATKTRMYLKAMAGAGKSRDYARQRMTTMDMPFENALWTEVRKELGLE